MSISTLLSPLLKLTPSRAAVRRLRGDVSDYSSKWVPKTTHLVTKEFRHSVKIMCAIASGKPILIPSYVTESAAAGHWLAEGDYLWRPGMGDEGSEELIAAAGHWREVLAQQRGQPRGIFRGWRVFVLMTSKEQVDTYTALFTAGGATVDQDFSRFMQKLAHAPRSAASVANGERDVVVTENNDAGDIGALLEQARKNGVETREAGWVVGFIECLVK